MDGTTDQEVVSNRHRENRLVPGRRLGNGIDEPSPGFGVVVDHFDIESPLPRGFIRPFSIADKSAVPVTMQPGTETTVDTRDMFGSASPRFTKLLFLTGMNPPPVDRKEHVILHDQRFGTPSWSWSQIFRARCRLHRILRAIVYFAPQDAGVTLLPFYPYLTGS